MRISTYVILTTLGLSWATACTYEENYEEIRFTHPEPQALLIEKLQEKRIVFKLTEDNAIIYNVKYESTVSELISEVSQIYHPPRGISFTEPKFTKRLQSLLEEKGIDHRVYYLSGRMYITWEENVSELVKPFKDVVDEEATLYAKKKMIEEDQARLKRKEQ